MIGGDSAPPLHKSDNLSLTCHLNIFDQFVIFSDVNSHQRMCFFFSITSAITITVVSVAFVPRTELFECCGWRRWWAVESRANIRPRNNGCKIPSKPAINLCPGWGSCRHDGNVTE